MSLDKGLLKKRSWWKRLFSSGAIDNMLVVHGEKYIKAWLDITQWQEKTDDLQRDYDLLADEVKQKVEDFINRRLSNPEGAMVPEKDLQAGVSIKLGLDTCHQNLKQAQLEFDFFAKVINQINAI